MRSIILLDLPGELELKESDGRHGDIKLINMVLCEVGDSTSVVMCRSPDTRLNVTSEQFDQGGLSSSIRTNDRDSTVEPNIDIDASQDDLLRGVAESDLVELK